MARFMVAHGGLHGATVVGCVVEETAGAGGGTRFAIFGVLPF
jgi:hypothetical protein